MKYTIYRDELTELWVRYKYTVEADSQEDAIKEIESSPYEYDDIEDLYDTAEILDIEYCDENLKLIHES